MRIRQRAPDARIMCVDYRCGTSPDVPQRPPVRRGRTPRSERASTRPAPSPWLAPAQPRTSTSSRRPITRSPTTHDLTSHGHPGGSVLDPAADTLYSIPPPMEWPRRRRLDRCLTQDRRMTRAQRLRSVAVINARRARDDRPVSRQRQSVATAVSPARRCASARRPDQRRRRWTGSRARPRSGCS